MEAADKSLFRAIDRKDTDGVRAALANGANLDARRKSNTPLLDAVFGKDPAVVSILARAGARMADVDGSRDPLNEALSQGDLPTLAALLDTPPTPKGLVDHLLQPGNFLLRSNHNRRNLLREAWKDVFAELAPRIDFSSPEQGDRWWLSASESYYPDPTSIRTLMSQVHPRRDTVFFRALADHGLSISVMEAMEDAGHLDGDMLFNAFMGGHKGFLEAALSQPYPPIPSLKWLLRKAGKVPGGADYFSQRSPIYLARAIGQHASLPLGRIIGKIIGSDPIQDAASARLPDGSTTLHLLMGGSQDFKRRLAIAQALMQAGADPMTPNLRGMPACYKACMIRGRGLEPLELMGAYGADLAAGGLVEQYLDRDTDSYPHLVQAARGALRRYQVQAEHAMLQDDTPRALSRQAPRRF